MRAEAATSSSGTCSCSSRRPSSSSGSSWCTARPRDPPRSGTPTRSASSRSRLIYAAVGVALLVVVSRLPLERIRQLAPTLVVTALVLCLGVLAVGARINGARRWIDVGPLVFQPSELAKLAVVVWTAAYLSRRPPPRTLQELARPLGLLVLVFAALVLVEPDLGTALTLLLVVGAILLVSGTRMRLLASAYGIVFALAAIAAWSSPYRRDRLLTFLDPVEGPDRRGAPERAGADQLRLGRDLRTRHRVRAGVRSTTCPRRTPT